MPKDTEQPLDDRLAQERQDYLDAEEAYRAVLNEVAQTKPLPEGYKANYAPESRGHERAATDPYVKENHPEMAGAARRLAKEEAEFLALDEPIASHAQNNCSISRYTADKVYEYYAVFETIYLLASDAAFRDQVVAQIEAAYQGSAVGHILRADELQNEADRLMLHRPDALDFFLDDVFNGGAATPDLQKQQDDIDADLRKIGAQTEFHMAVSNEKIKAYFLKNWNDIKAKYYGCGLFYAITATGVDGAFVAAEVYAGLSFLRVLKFSRKIIAGNAARVTIEGLNGKALASVEYSLEALDAKYGKPEANHIGGFEPDTNRQIPDKPAVRLLEDKREAERQAETDTPAESSEAKDSQTKGGANAPRPIEELAPNRNIPGTKYGKFNQWWNELTPEELDMLWAETDLRDTIEDRVRYPPGNHEWLMVSQGRKLKRLGFTMEEIKAMTSPTKKISGPVPGSPDARWRHTNDDGSTGENSGKMHNALSDVIEQANNRDEMLEGMEDFADGWLDHGIDSFPVALREAILERKQQTLGGP
jgi:hypothetical protein